MSNTRIASVGVDLTLGYKSRKTGSVSAIVTDICLIGIRSDLHKEESRARRLRVVVGIQ